MMCPKSWYRRDALLGSALITLMGCAAQATTDYQGDPLFSMYGRVELSLTTATDQPLVPALAFTTQNFEEIHFETPEVSGEFPANFQVEVYTPPPASVIGGYETEDIPGEPRYTLGYITAVTNDHLPMLYYARSLHGGDTTCDDEGCLVTRNAESDGGDHKGTVSVFCPHGVSDFPLALDAPRCSVRARTGDPMFVSFADDPMFAGAANNYVVLYLEGPAKPAGYLSRFFGAPEGLTAGYHLLRILPLDRDGEDARQACRDQAQSDAAVNYNAAHGTKLTMDDVFGCSKPSCGELDQHLRAVRGEWYRLMLDRGCQFGPNYVPEPNSAATVSLRVQPGLNFVNASLAFSF